jgi:hypothetical protein
MGEFGRRQAELMRQMGLPPKDHITTLLGIIMMLGDELGLDPDAVLRLLEGEAPGVVAELRRGGLIRALPEGGAKP